MCLHCLLSFGLLEPYEIAEATYGKPNPSLLTRIKISRLNILDGSVWYPCSPLSILKVLIMFSTANPLY